MFSTCELCDVVVEKVFVPEEGEYGCPGCWEAYGEIHQDLKDRVCHLTFPDFCGAPVVENLQKRHENFVINVLDFLIFFWLTIGR